MFSKLKDHFALPLVPCLYVTQLQYTRTVAVTFVGLGTQQLCVVAGGQGSCALNGCVRMNGVVTPVIVERGVLGLWEPEQLS